MIVFCSPLSRFSTSLRLLVFTIGHWQPKIGDPSFVGWFTVVSYYLCAALGLAHLLQGRARIDKVDARFRTSLTGIVAVLGITKHFNLPGAVTEVGRIVANSISGYEFRRWPQAVVLLLITISVILGVRWATRHPWFSEIWKRRAPEMICLAYLCGLVVLRAVSLHQVGALLGAEVFGVRVNWIVELSGIYALMVIVVIRILAPPEQAR